MKFDTLIVGGTAVIPGQGEVKASIGITDGKVQALLGPDVEAEADEKIDASGKHIFPGAIDPHTHTVRAGPPFHQYGLEGRTAAIGGVTTFFNYIRRAGKLDQHFAAEKAAAEEVALVDFAFHFGGLTDEQAEDAPRYMEQYGVTSFKFHFNYRQEKPNDLGYGAADIGLCQELLMQSARHPGMVVNTHAEDDEIIKRIEHRVKATGRGEQAAWNDARPPHAEGVAVRTACFLAEVTGGTLYIVHMSTRYGVEEVRNQRRQGNRRIFIETCPQYFTLNVDNVKRPSAKVPPIRTKDHADALWEAILDGTVDTIANDHGGRKAQGGDNPTIWNVGPSFPGMGTMLPLMFSEGYHKRGLSLQRIAEITSRNTARIFGLYPKKGTIQPGSDADLVIVDLEQERVVDPDYLQSEADFSLWEGWNLKGWPVQTLVRGKTVMKDGKVLGQQGYGRYQPRFVSSAPSQLVTAG